MCFLHLSFQHFGVLHFVPHLKLCVKVDGFGVEVHK